jgi:hypothetical protein
MVIVEICRQFKWDYYTYLAQPVWFVDLIIEGMKIDAMKAEREQAKAKRQAGGKI